MDKDLVSHDLHKSELVTQHHFLQTDSSHAKMTDSLKDTLDRLATAKQSLVKYANHTLHFPSRSTTTQNGHNSKNAGHQKLSWRAASFLKQTHPQSLQTPWK